jgi:hypothetical protein
MTKNAVAIRHLMFEDLGIIGPLLAAHGYTSRYLDAGIDEIDTGILADADLLVVLGGPIGANDGDRYPFLILTPARPHPGVRKLCLAHDHFRVFAYSAVRNTGT